MTALELTASLGPDGFGHYFAGLSDGEGSFILARIKRPHGYSVNARFGINLRDDDIGILRECKRRLRLGSLYIVFKHQSPTAQWTVRSKDECQLLCAVFDAYPLRAKKRRDFAVWRRAVDEWCGMRASGFNTTPYDWTRMLALADELERVRQYRDPFDTHGSN